MQSRLTESLCSLVDSLTECEINEYMNENENA
jgi:hypothetical protein